MPESAPFTFLMVPVPQADMLVRRAAALFEPSSPTSTLQPELIAAHVTLLSPFLPPSLLDEAVVDTLSAICGQNARHAFTLAKVAVFDGGAVYLPPHPAEPLQRLMHMVWKRWPEMPPYGGQYVNVVPHVTLAIVEDEPERIARVTDFAQPFLPIHAEAAEVQLLAVRGQTWQLMHRFELA